MQWHLAAFPGIKGYVTDIWDNPLENVHISVTGRIYHTDNNGRFEFSGTAGQDVAVFSRIGYETIFFRTDRIPEKVIMELKPIPIPGIKVNEDKLNKKFMETGDGIQIFLDQDRPLELGELLEKRSSLDIDGVVLKGESAVLKIPGFKPGHVIVLLDGIPLNAQGGSVDLSSIPLNLIESIEILRGTAVPGSYGTAGVAINLNTCRNYPGKLQLVHSFGSFGLNGFVVNLVKDFGKIGLNIFLDRIYARNDFKYRSQSWENTDTLYTRENNDKKVFDINIQLSYQNRSVKASYTFLYQDFLKKLPGPTNNLPLYENSRLRGRICRNYLTWQKLINDIVLEMRIFHFRENTEYDNTRISEPWSNYPDYYVKNRNNDYRSGVTTNLKYNFYQGYTSIGFSYEKEDFSYEELTDPEDSISPLSQEHWDVLAMLNLEHKLGKLKFKLATSGQYIRTERFHDHWLGVINPEISFTSSFAVLLGARKSNSLVLPSFYDLYWQGDTQAVGNPQLTPERANSIQYYLNLQYQDNYFKIIRNASELEDMIIWIPDYNKTWKPHNVAAASVNNWQIETRWHLWSKATLGLIYTGTVALNKTRDGDGEPSAFFNKKIMYTPDHTWKIYLDYDLNAVQLNISYRYTGEQWTTMDQLTDEKRMDSFATVDLDIFYNIDIGRVLFRPGLIARNIMCTSYELYEYSPQPGYNWEVSLRLFYDL